MTIANLKTQVETDIAAITSGTTLTDLIALSRSANEVGADRTGLDAELITRTTALTGSESALELLQLSVALSTPTIQPVVSAGQVIKHVGGTIDGLPLLEARGQAIDEVTHPKLATLLDDSLGVTESYNAFDAVVYGYADTSDDGDTIFANRDNSSAIEMTLIIDDEVVDTATASSSSYITDKPFVSDDGTKAIQIAVQNGNVACYYRNGSIISNTTLGSSSRNYAGFAMSKDGSIAVAVYQDGSSSQYKVATSTNGGSVWDTSVNLNRVGFTYTSVYSVGVDADASHIYIINAANQLIKSLDSGVTWSATTLSSLGLGSATTMWIRVSDDGQRVVYYYNNTLYLSDDYCASFSEVIFPEYLGFVKSISDGAYGFNTTTKRIYTSLLGVDINSDLPVKWLAYTDDGISWVHSSPSLVEGKEGLEQSQAYPLAVSSDETFMISSTSSSIPQVLKSTLFEGKYLPFSLGYKVVGG